MKYINHATGHYPEPPDPAPIPPFIGLCNIVGFVNFGTFSAAGCLPAPPFGGPPWDGGWVPQPIIPINGGSVFGGGVSLSFNGRRFFNAIIQNLTLPGPIVITVLKINWGGPTGLSLAWQGQLHHPNFTPVGIGRIPGIYTQTGGCSATPPTITMALGS